LNFFISYIIVFMRGRQECFLQSFFLSHGFILMGFSGKVFNETYYDTKGCFTFFLYYKFFPIGFFSSKILTRHILDRHPRESVVNIINRYVHKPLYLSLKWHHITYPLSHTCLYLSLTYLTLKSYHYTSL